MNQTTSKQNGRLLVVRFRTLAIVCGLTLICLSAIQAQTKTGAAAAPKGKGFATAQEAADALVSAAEQYDEAALAQILGPDSYDIIHTGEPVRDKENTQAFAAQARSKMSLDYNKLKTRANVVVGEEDWPMPVPIVKQGTHWYFDVKSGRQELLYRRVGKNELDAIEVCRGYVEAQNEYALTKKKAGEPNQYAQKIISPEGEQDALAWKNADGTWDGPIAEKIAQEIAKGYSQGQPYHGYFFKILKGQGPAAPLGELDYVIKGVMIGGFALLASPAQYRSTGVKTFMVSQDGVVWEKDLGPKTGELFQAMDRFNPDRSWSPVKEN